ncbi:phosphoglucomutase/phosphomannomutase family protein [Putridiphycobacter roseus]|uniref:Phosphoglucomutase/phosphomannomutase family protein n=1 Tax=Putridiphycobacter roseus TaxID=2219161 RepID=A0A2W1NEE1_9FLAO|nr:phosphoglucomutase/phosphomannomutase family protein [Putridiphycobacter roseus]PZE17473.1 phosphoglucomutase/phosphomannomutase family protein [Putridiphycobacter roseus]
MTKIKFGTDGWRAIIAQEYTVDNVARVSLGVASWLKSNFDKPSIVIGHDCRFGGALFVETALKIFISQNIKVITTKKGFVSTPMVSLSTLNHSASLGVVITASHNPPSYNGYKLKGNFGGPLLPNEVAEIEVLIPDANSVDLAAIKITDRKFEDLLKYIDMEQEYLDAVNKEFDLEAIKSSGLKLAYDAMYGAGQSVIKRILPDLDFLHCDYNPSFMGQAPEPIAKNLTELSEFIKSKGNIDCALATDGDADRIGLYDANGEFVDSHHIILLLIHYLVKYKGLTGKVVTGFSSTPRIKAMCAHYGIEHVEVPIGFKYIAGIMADENEDVLLGGEESGGIAIKTHIPERDGIWIGLTIWEFMAKSGKSLDTLIQEVYEIVGEFAFERSDLHIDNELKEVIVEKCKTGKYNFFGKYKVERIEDMDGYKYHFDENRWLMIRPSGTEPVLRTYAEAPTLKEVRHILENCKLTIGA